MRDFIDKNELIYKRQFGFRAEHSTKHALISTTDAIKSQIDNSNRMGGDILCEKLAFYGFTGKFNSSSSLCYQIVSIMFLYIFLILLNLIKMYRLNY